MKVLLVCIPDTGHILPAVGIAARFVEMYPDVELLFASLDHVRGKVEGKGLKFLSAGCFTEQQTKEYHRLNRTIFDASASMGERLNVASKTILEMYGGVMTEALLKHFRGCSRSELPDLVVTDSLTLAGYELAEALQLPLAVESQMPLNQALTMAGLNSYNLPLTVPLETMLLNSSANPGWLMKFILSPLLKWLYPLVARLPWDAPRNRLRARLGLPPMSRSSGGLLSVQPGVPRHMFICGVSWELNARRPLPSNWHLVGPTGVDYTATAFPPPLLAKDSQVQQFLQQAADAEEPVIYVATGTMVVLQPEQLAAMVAAFQKLASARKTRFIWSLKEDTQQLLPQALRSSSSSSSSGVGETQRILVLPFVNQPAVLAHPQTKGFITHAGLGSTHEGLAAGKPLLCLPFTADQPTVAQQVVNKQLGLQLATARLKAEDIVAAIGQLLDEPTYARNAAALGQRLRAQSGPTQACELLMAFATGS